MRRPIYYGTSGTRFQAVKIQRKSEKYHPLKVSHVGGLSDSWSTMMCHVLNLSIEDILIPDPTGRWESISRSLRHSHENNGNCLCAYRDKRVSN